MKINILKKISWQYAIGEVLLIFIGITAAISFNNWNEAQKARKIEIKTLEEIRSAISHDLEDIEENIIGYEQRVLVYNMIVDHMENQKPIDDTLHVGFSILQGLTTFLSNIGPYETLKSRGLDTITNDSLRLAVSRYYDFEYDRIVSNEKLHHEHYFSYLKPYILTHFKIVDYRIIPLDYDTMMDDFEFQQIIKWARRTDSYMLERYQFMKELATHISENIDQEIQRLQ